MLDLSLDLPGTASTGIVGDRQLIAVQTFDLARLTTHPVVLVPGTFVAVGGRGPRGDSNESGKTSFLAATALLLGDPEWRMTGGGPAATASLLFEPETAGVAAHTYAAARQGYVIGVFAEPERPAESALTVWCRINATNPYFQVRYTDGMHLVGGDSHRERSEAADRCWGALPNRTQLGAHTYAERLYGDSPRALAYVARRGKQRSAPSLLQMNAGGFSPEQIGDDLIRLTGRAAAFETEGRQRQSLDEAQRTLAGKQRDDERNRREEEDQLAGVSARNEARRYLSDAERLWTLHFAKGYLDVLGRQDALAAVLAEADENVTDSELSVAQAQADLDQLSVPAELEARLQKAVRDHESLKAQAESAAQTRVEARVASTAATAKVWTLEQASDGWNGPPAAEVAGQLTDARRTADEAQQGVGSARALHREAELHLAAVEAGTEGHAGKTAELLRSEGVQAAPLLDLEVEARARGDWEPRLALYDAAVVVAAGQLDDALIAASDLPGAVLIGGEDGDLPEGIVAAPAGAAGFLRRLEAMTTLDDPRRAQDDSRGVVVIGDFPEPQTGRSARLERAQENLAEARTLLREADDAVARAQLDIERLTGDLARAEAAEQLNAARETLREAERAAASAQQAADELVEPTAATEAIRLQVAAQVTGHELVVRGAQERLDTRKTQLADARNRRLAAQRALDSLQVEYWRAGWNQSADAARTALLEENRSEKSLRNRSAELLQDALSALSISSDGSGAPSRALGEVARERNKMQDDPERGRLPATLGDVARPLQDFLHTHQDSDQVIEERVLRAREKRDAELELAVEEAQRLESALLTLQDGVEQRIRQALEAISDQYDRLNQESGGFGADLDIRARRPDGPTDRWRWSVTPRWKRSANGRPLPYDNQANTAQEKLATVQLVLAALLAAPNPRGRVLVLDELGDSLGVTHRREVLREIAATARAKGVTVLGTCQDSVMSDAAQHCGELIYFEYPSYSEALNRPTRMFGFDEQRGRVELTADVLRDARPLV